MSRLFWLLGTVAITAIALLVLFRGEALAAFRDQASGDSPACASTDSFVPAFCVNVPTSSERRETTVSLVSLPSLRADVRVEVSVPGSEAAALAVGVDRSVERVEALFGRTFTTRPRALVLGGVDSFATGAKVATLIEQETSGGSDWGFPEEELVGRAVAASGAVSLAQLVSVADFHAAYARLERPLYAFAADAVRAMRTRLGWDGLVRVLGAIGTGESVAVAYESEARETLAQLERHLAASAAPQIVATTANDADGNVHWTLYAGRASSQVHVSITGTTDYRVSFTVQTDAVGMYRGSFGSTAAPGTYTVLAGGAVTTLVTGR